ncbi:MAG: Ni/Fe-hydrogenase cytochrome b subunit [Deltaproteobacteria bacterium]|nr:Ni/Fe-hydrogenase cytochrome b subunit [Deltaproteobacteria bacterium]
MPRAYLRGLLTPFNAVAGVILAVGIPVTIYRFVYGIGAVSNLSQTNPWGIWIGLDVASGVALAAGGYTLASAVFIFGLQKYRPVVRPAILTGFLGYIFVVIGLLADLGRPWNLPVPMVYSFGLTSVMFEVAWCVALYCTVLALELSPALFEWLGMKKARAWAVRIALALTVFGVVLSTLHQSSLGSLFLMARGKLHPLWYSPFIPIFFFVSSIAAGLSMVIVESGLSHRLFSARQTGGEHVDLDGITLGLGKAASVVLFAYFFAKLLGVADGQGWPLLSTPYGHWFLVELLGFVLVPCFLYAFGVRNRNVKLVRVAAAWTVLGVVLNRFNVSFIGYRWDQPDRYVPHWMEVAISLTIITVGILAFRWIVNRMPVLREHPDFRGSAH